MIVTVLCCGVIILLGRLTDNDNPFGVLLAVPIMGFVDGLLLPIVQLPTRFFITNENTAKYYQIIMYSAILAIFGVIYFYGKEIRHKFVNELRFRALATWERAMLCFVGVLLLIYSTFVSTDMWNTDTNATNLKAIITVMGVCCFVMTITVIMVIVIGNKQSYYHTKVSKMQDNMIIVMAELVENRDENTGGHIKRTAKYVEIIAKQLRKNGQYTDILTDAYIKELVVAAPLHDIGKIHVSDVILNKPGRLNDDEFEAMKQHAAEGREVLTHAKKHLGDFGYIDIAIQMAGSHHEWWDGSAKGYPDHIKGEEIPLCARIMAVADVFDALTTRRCYKEPIKLDKAYKIIKEESGTHFDPVVVEAFFGDKRRIEAAYSKFTYESRNNTLLKKLREKSDIQDGAIYEEIKN